VPAVEIYKGMQDHANTSGETLKKGEQVEAASS